MSQLSAPEMVIDIWQKKVGVPAHAPGSETATWEELGVE